MVHSSFQPLRTSEPEDEDDCEPGEWDGAEDDILIERPQPGNSRRVRPTLPRTLGRLSLGVVRHGKVAGPLALAVVGALAVSVLAEYRPWAAPADGLHAARARTQDSVEEDGMMQQTGMQDKPTVAPVQQMQGGVYYQSATRGAAVVQTSSGAGVQSGGCGCGGESSVAFCSSMTCPTGYLQREGAEHIECRGDRCSLEADLSMCCNRRSTCDGDRGTYTCKPGTSLRDNAAHILCGSHACGPEDNELCCEARATCGDYGCASGTALKTNAQSIVCAGGSCSESDCCEKIPAKEVTVDVEKEVTVETKKEVVVDEKPEQDIMLCDLNCYNEGVDSVSVELPEDDTKDLDSCRDACVKNEDCSGIVYKKDFQTTGESTCHGKKDIHVALCQPGGDFYTEVLKHRPWGKCALLGDPHIAQFDRPPQLGKPVFDDYDAGDYVLLASKELTIHGRFGFTERFPTATSTKGIAVYGSKISNKALVASYSEKNKRFIAWYDGKEILKKKGETFDDGLLVAKYDDMDPTQFHSEARHTIGEHADKVASWTFEWKDVPLKIYMLLGPDNVNAVLEMQKLEYAMDGLCGNFNCDPDDEDHKALAARSMISALTWGESNFEKADGTFSEKEFKKGTVDEEVLTKCDPDLLAKGREACGTGKGVDDAQAKACLVDVCEAKSVDVATMDVETVSIEQEVEVDIDKH